MQCWCTSGAAGSFAIQFAKAAGAFVVATVGSETKARLALELGADHVINYQTCTAMGDAFKVVCPELFSVVMDGVGGSMQDDLIECTAPLGKVLLTGYISEYPHTEGKYSLTHHQFSASSASLRDKSWGRTNSPPKPSKCVDSTC